MAYKAATPYFKQPVIKALEKLADESKILQINHLLPIHLYKAAGTRFGCPNKRFFYNNCLTPIIIAITQIVIQIDWLF